MNALHLEAARRYRNTKAAQLRAILADGKWHDAQELAARVGHRFGGALHILRRGDDGQPPWDVVSARLTEDASRWTYRLVGELPYVAVRRRVSMARQVLELQREVERLRRELVALRGGGA